MNIIIIIIFHTIIILAQKHFLSTKGRRTAILYACPSLKTDGRQPAETDEHLIQHSVSVPDLFSAPSLFNQRFSLSFRVCGIYIAYQLLSHPIQSRLCFAVARHKHFVITGKLTENQIRRETVTTLIMWVVKGTVCLRWMKES